MVIPRILSQAPAAKRAQCGALITDLLVAISILLTALIPISFCVLNHQKLLRLSYYRAVAMELVDGEMEVLAAGEWRSFHEGSQPYPVRGEAARNLPPGRFDLRHPWRHRASGMGALGPQARCASGKDGDNRPQAAK